MSPEQYIAWLEAQLRFHDAAEGPQYFAEQATRELVQRELDRARAEAARMRQDGSEPPPAPTLPDHLPDAL